MAVCRCGPSRRRNCADPRRQRRSADVAGGAEPTRSDWRLEPHEGATNERGPSKAAAALERTARGGPRRAGPVPVPEGAVAAALARPAVVGLEAGPLRPDAPLPAAAAG